MPYQVSRWLRRMVTVGVAVVIANFVSVSGSSGETTVGDTDGVTALEAAQLAGLESRSGARARAPVSAEIVEDGFIEEYDPWEPFNETMFSFNRELDRVVLKPVAKGWDKVLPDPLQLSLGRAFDNLGMPRRLVNNLFQVKITGAGRELARFVLNSTIGIAGLFDVAKGLGIEESDEDTGQTLGVYGVGPGPYLVLPLLPPLTVRDGIGFAADAALDPFNYVVFPGAALTSIGVGKRVNDRALNLELFETVEETSLDLYSAARNAYLQRRQKAIEE
ncbi:MAG: VacJ family lipoprotein [Candidatus Rokubacteria bacterium]|nr:VacJ family lipoprotein [Candidatus Rokubacteria bacterium]